MASVFLQKRGRRGGSFLQGVPAFLFWGVPVWADCPTVRTQNQKVSGSRVKVLRRVCVLKNPLCLVFLYLNKYSVLEYPHLVDRPGTTMLKKSSYHQMLLMSSLLKRKIKSNFFAECGLSWFLSAEPGSLRLHICHCCQSVAEKVSETIELIVPSSGPRARLHTVTQTVTHTHIFFFLNFKTAATVRQAGQHVKSVTDKYVKGEKQEHAGLNSPSDLT